MNSELATLIAEELKPAIIEAIENVTREALAETTPPPLRLLSVASCAERAGVCAETIRRAIRRGDLSVVTSLGRRPRIRPDDLERFLKPKGKDDEKK